MTTRHRWRELDVQSHERDDGAAVRHVGSCGAFGWVGVGPSPEREALTTPAGHERRFRSAAAAKAAVDRRWQ